MEKMEGGDKEEYKFIKTCHSQNIDGDERVDTSEI